MNRDIHTAMIYAAEHLSEVLDVCARVAGDDSVLSSALMTEFGFSDIQALCVMGMQVRRFTPHGLAQLRAGLRTYEELLRE